MLAMPVSRILVGFRQREHGGLPEHAACKRETGRVALLVKPCGTVTLGWQVMFATEEWFGDRGRAGRLLHQDRNARLHPRAVRNLFRFENELACLNPIFQGVQRRRVKDDSGSRCFKLSTYPGGSLPCT